MKSVSVNIFHTEARESDAGALSERLNASDVRVHLIKVVDDSFSRALQGKLFFFENNPTGFKTAKTLAAIVSDIEITVPGYYDSHGSSSVTHALWLTGEPQRDKKSNTLKDRALTLLSHLRGAATSLPSSVSPSRQEQKQSRTSYSGGKKLIVSSHVSSLSPSYGNFRLCVCEGSNENCRYCSGTGRITTSFTPSKGPGPLATAGHNGLKKLGSRTTQLKRSKRSAEVLGSTVILPEKKTSSKVKLNQLNRASIVYSLFGEGLRSNDEWLACNTCRIFVHRTGINRHVDEKHRGSRANVRARIQPHKRSSNRSSNVERELSRRTIVWDSNQEFVACGTCGVPVKRKRLEKHYRKAHRGSSTSTLHVSQRHEHKPRRERNNDKLIWDSEYESPQSVRAMDHTRLYAHAFRELGRYGSHPSHDGFDDESNP